MKPIHNLKDKAKKVFEIMDRKDDLTIYDYIFLRKVSSGLKACGDNGIITPVIFLN